MLLRLDGISLSYGAKPLLDKASLLINERERVCLVGRNGEGKSSLMRIAAGLVAPDDGQRWIRPGARLAMLDQDIETSSGRTVEEVVFSGVTTAGDDDSAVAIPDHRVRALLSKLDLDPSWSISTLSGGWRRRTLLARALACEPEILLLDEPTNHLDIEAIEWLENVMLGFKGALLFVSHDRYFVNRLATRITELDRGNLTEWPGNYDEYQRRKALQLANEAKESAAFDRKWSAEEVWIRKGVEARRTRNEGRVRALEKMREERRQRRVLSGPAKIEVNAAEPSSKLVFELENVSLRRGDKQILRHFSLRVQRGDRIGIVGPNGFGKSSLIKLLLGELSPDDGSVRRAPTLKLAYYDQQREQLDLSASVFDNVNDGNEFVGEGTDRRHIASWLRDFLFRPEQYRTPASALSGGERNRLLLSRIFARPANLIVLDEPTNDLDIETLELLEEKIAEFEGSLLLVSHDRTFLDRIVSSLLILEGDGRVQEFVGGWSDWKTWQSQQQKNLKENRHSTKTAKISSDTPSRQRPVRLSYKEQKEFESLPEMLESLEARKVTIENEVMQAEFYSQAEGQIRDTLQTLQQLDEEISRAWERWAELEARSLSGHKSTTD